MNLPSVLPLALVMIAGPQIISAIFLASTRNARRNSLAFVLGAGLALLLALSVWYIVFRTVRHTADATGGGGGGHRLLDWVVLVVLVALIPMVYARRGRQPKWMKRLEEANPRFAFGLGFLLLAAMPTDEATMLTVAASLAGHHRPWWHLLPFAGLTLLLLALPLLSLLALGQRALAVLPKIRNWADSHAWVVSELVILIFIATTVHDLLS
ncbi:Sap, sulfolipid-1-addressing protein [Micromonospora pallida]|uniref:Sap, sulfolipid-1-addressing protein n=1 Tax=Micromonospora pallida TaxID=145854 RepID=A0A1C6TAJ5_9ACTN|nr:GAP family protein [Micromonospora pallida]SCL38667.1 Sap, sulfolipid-1-addressing protein [Micromonospora pallida]